MREPAASSIPRRSEIGKTILVTSVGLATGARAAAAALACASPEGGLLIELSDERAPRPSLVATAAARELEERLAGHLPEAGVASRGRLCWLTLPGSPEGIERVPAALPLARETVSVVHLPQRLFQPLLAEPRVEFSAALLRADLRADRALAALAAGDAMARGLRVVVLKQPLGWIAARAALLGALPDAAGVLSPRLTRRLLKERAGP